MRYFEIITEATRIKMAANPDGTRAMVASPNFKKAVKGMLATREADKAFTLFVKEKTTQPYANLKQRKEDDKDFSGNLSGVWHCHLVKGKVIVIYMFDNTHIELVDIGPHSLYDKKNSSKLARYIETLGDTVHFLPFQWDVSEVDKQEGDEEKAGKGNEPPAFAPDAFEALEVLVYSMLQDKGRRAQLETFARTGAGPFSMSLVGVIKPTSMNAEAQFAQAWKAHSGGKTIQEYVAAALRSVR